MASEIFKVLNFLNALTSDSEMGKSLDDKIKNMMKSLSPSEKKQGMRYGGKASKKCGENRDNRNTRKVNSQGDDSG